MSSQQNHNLKDLLKASGYNDVDHETTAIPPYIVELSRPVLRRVRALKKVQLESLEVEAQFYKDVHELEKKYQPLFESVNGKRRAIVLGEHEPADSEADLPLLHGVPASELEKIEEDAPVEGGEPSKGVPGFWFNTLNAVAQISETIKEYDEPILKYLTDVTSNVHSNPSGFTLNFHFAENPFFSNSVLIKYYELNIDLDKDEPFDYDGPTVVKGQGCEIQWKEGKNVTQKTVKKKQKKGPQAGKFVTKTVTNESFFNFFQVGPKILEGKEGEGDDENVEKVREDFEIGQILRDQVIPRAILFYTGEAADDDMDYFDDEEDDDEDDEGMANSDGSDEEEE